jgi:Ca-activated chloride channel family protein
MKQRGQRPALRWGAWVAFLLGTALVGRAENVRDLIAQGNQHYAAGRYAEALKCYEEAQARQINPPPELLHDLAATHFKLGQLDEARDLWVRVKEAGDAEFEARTRYNLGNCDYAEALAAMPQNPQRTLELLATAADQYRTSLQLDPLLTDARANLELTQRLKRQIEEQLKDQPQSQPSQSQKQKNKQKQQSTQPAQSQPSEQSEQDQQDQQDQSATSQPAQTQPSQQPKPQEGQEGEQQQQDQSQPQQGEENQQQPAATQPQTMPAETQPGRNEQPAQESTVIHLTREQAERLLQMIRDAEKARREKLTQQRTATQKKVERDW